MSAKCLVLWLRLCRLTQGILDDRADCSPGPNGTDQRVIRSQLERVTRACLHFIGLYGKLELGRATGVRTISDGLPADGEVSSNARAGRVPSCLSRREYRQRWLFSDL